MSEFKILIVPSILVILGTILQTIGHELAHYFIFKKCNTRPIVVTFGFGPTLWRQTVDGTEFIVNMILLGGANFTKIEDYNKLSKREKIYCNAAGVIFNFSILLISSILLAVTFLQIISNYTGVDIAVCFKILITGIYHVKNTVQSSNVVLNVLDPLMQVYLALFMFCITSCFEILASVIPFYGSDGEHILEALIQNTFHQYLVKSVIVIIMLGEVLWRLF